MSSLKNKDEIAKQLGVFNIGQYVALAGVAFEFKVIELAVAPEAKLYWKWEAPEYKYTVKYFRSVLMDQERGFYRVYTDFTGGTLGASIPGINLRSDSTVLPQTVCNKMATAPTSLGTPDVVYPIFGQPGQGTVLATGSTATDVTFTILEPGKTTITEFENNSAEACYFQMNIVFGEISPRAMMNIKEL